MVFTNLRAGSTALAEQGAGDDDGDYDLMILRRTPGMENSAMRLWTRSNQSLRY